MRWNFFLKTVAILVLSLAVYFLTSLPAWAKYPDKPISFVVPWPAGGGTDISLRPLVEAASRFLKQPIAMEYHPGGSTAVGLGMLRVRKPDGYSIGQATLSSLVSQHLRKVSYDLLKDFTFIMQYADYISGLVVKADSPWKNLQELMDYAKANPGKIRFSSSGPGGPQHLAIEYLGKQNKIKWIHIPFEGGPPALAAVLGGHVEAYSTTMHAKPHILAGRLRLLVTYGEKRNPSFPEVPTLRELGYEDIYSNSMILLGPKGLSSEVRDALHQAFKMALDDPEFIKGCGKVDHAVVYRGPEDAYKNFVELNSVVGNLIGGLNLQKK